MTGSSPHSPRPPRRRRAAKPLMPWALIGILCGLYVLVGLLLSAPAPPYWIWSLAALGIPLLAIGLIRSRLVDGRAARWELLTYLGALLLVVALAIATNYTGSDQSFDDIRFSVALLGLVVLTLLAVMLTAAAVVISAQTSEKLMQIMDYRQSLTVLIGTCFVGMGLGGIAGFLTTTL